MLILMNGKMCIGMCKHLKNFDQKFFIILAINEMQNSTPENVKLSFSWSYTAAENCKRKILDQTRESCHCQK